MMKSNQSIIRISDIARLAGVSAGTVDRVLHNRGRVSDENRAKVEAVLKLVDYRPNPMARSLANRRQYRFVSLTPEYKSGEYWEEVNNGIQAAARTLSNYNVVVEQRFFDQYNGASFSKQIESLLADVPDGVVIATLFEQQSRELAEKLDLCNVPYVFIDSDIPGCNNLSYFGVDSYQSGKVGARLMLGNGPDSILSVLYEGADGELSLQSRLRYHGFCDSLSEAGFTGSHQLLKLNSNSSYPLRQTIQETLQQYNPQGIIVFNSRIHEVVKGFAPEEAARYQLIGYDAIDVNRDALVAGKITYLIGQRSDIQGYDSIKALSNHLLFEEEVAKQYLMPIDILIRENIAYNHNYNL